MNYEIEFRNCVIEKISSWSLGARAELALYESIVADLERDPFASLKPLNRPFGFHEYLAKFNKGESPRRAVLWFELVEIGDRQIFRATDAYDITIVKVPTSKTLRSADAQKS